MDDNSAYRDLFFEESDTYLDAINDDVLKLEENPEDLSIINSIFRSAHTLKGMAATMGYETMSKLTHYMESVLDLLQKEELEITHDLVTLIFDSLDGLSDIVEDLRNDGDGELDVADLIAELTSISESADGSSETEKASESTSTSETSLVPQFEKIDSSDKKVIDEGEIQGYNSYAIALKLDEETTMKSARAFLVINKLETLGDLILTEPTVEDLETGDFEGIINLLYLTKLSAEDVLEAIEGISEIDEVVVKEARDYVDAQPVVVEQEVAVKEEKEANAADTRQARARQTIRVDLSRLDHFMNLVSELIIHRSQLEAISRQERMTEINEPLEQVERITSELQEVVLQLRMQPFSVAVQRFPRMIRDLADELDKDLKLEILGNDTELDRTVVTELGEPLVHLLRNAADHGIELPKEREKAGKDPQGTITVSATQEGNRVVVTVADDGKGIDPAIIKGIAEERDIDTAGLSDQEIIQLIFHPGFSTKQDVTGVSGRGVGMDVVREKINTLNGSIETTSRLGKGSAFRITLPLTLSIIQSLLVKAGTETFALPQSAIETVELYKEDLIEEVHQSSVYSYKGELIPVIYLSKSLGFEEQTHQNSYIVIVTNRDKYYAIVVDDLVEQAEIVVKDLGKEFNNIHTYLGATILGDGEVVLILDIANICETERGQDYESL